MSSWLEAGAIVATPEGDIGQIAFILGEDIYVTHNDRAIGRGPWVMRAGHLSLASDDQWQAYQGRIAAHGGAR